MFGKVEYNVVKSSHDPNSVTLETRSRSPSTATPTVAASQNLKEREAMDSRTTQTRGSRQKLRSSCDTCHAAKVRCASKSPLEVCERCTTHGIQCSYSPSLRLTKQGATRKAAVTSPTQASRRSSSSSQFRKLSEQGYPSASVQRSYSSISPPSLVDDFGVGSLASPSTSTSSGYGIAGQAVDFVTPLWAEQEVPGQQNTVTPIGSLDGSMFWNEETVGRLFPKSALDVPSSQEPGLVPQLRNAPTHADGKHLHNDAAGTTSRTQSENDSVPASQSSCDCHARVLEALHLSQHLGAGIRKAGDFRIALDRVLVENKSAITRCSKVLDCTPCFAGSTSFLLVATLLSQILTLYQLACEIYLRRIPAETGHQTDQAIVPGPLRINFGAYELEEEDEVLLKKELVLIELRKVESLLGRLKGATKRLNDRSEHGTYDALLTSLTKNLRLVVKEIQPAR